jgi:hypothetical protein
VGDACDGDTDGDGVPNPADACPLVSAGGLDADGNGCPDVVGDLCALVQSFGLQQGIETSLCAKANAAAAASDATTASNILDAFINEVQAQRGRKIPPAIADLLIAFAQNAKLAL